MNLQHYLSTKNAHFPKLRNFHRFFQNLIIKGTVILSCFNYFEYNGPKFTAGKLPAILPSSFVVFLMIREVLPGVTVL